MSGPSLVELDAMVAEILRHANRLAAQSPAARPGRDVHAMGPVPANLAARHSLAVPDGRGGERVAAPADDPAVPPERRPRHIGVGDDARIAPPGVGVADIVPPDVATARVDRGGHATDRPGPRRREGGVSQMGEVSTRRRELCRAALIDAGRPDLAALVSDTYPGMLQWVPEADYKVAYRASVLSVIAIPGLTDGWCWRCGHCCDIKSCERITWQEALKLDVCGRWL